jgi:hypothetical protein
MPSAQVSNTVLPAQVCLQGLHRSESDDDIPDLAPPSEDEFDEAEFSVGARGERQSSRAAADVPQQQGQSKTQHVSSDDDEDALSQSSMPPLAPDSDSGDDLDSPHRADQVLRHCQIQVVL